MECNIGQDAILFNSFGNALLFKYIYEGRLKEIYMKYLILYYKTEILLKVALNTITLTLQLYAILKCL
jgi:hypothetical protein